MKQISINLGVYISNYIEENLKSEVPQSYEHF